ncbi:hypothetical protein P3T35_003160 [Kitasatospora sp. GP30]|uniref:hypothetical protein n=1 Tax=Kitasatospora sp. GP30 TaxID=3035084 RepID=UPI000CAE44F0|nr:hypothetical protein [Kitasatospora sp. GP30]MDH6141147.1 hypothetical protein [Kitasatospora sp. GP30]
MGRKPANRDIAHQLPIVERRRRAVEMKIAGHTWEQISDALGYGGRANAYNDIRRELQKSAAKLAIPLEEYRQLELDRLDAELVRLGRLQETIEAILEREHVTIQGGKVVLMDDDSPVPDYGPVLQAADRLLKIEDARRRNAERRAKLLGLDAPTKTEGVLTLDAIDQQLQQLNGELAALEAEDPEASGAEDPES